jgi:acyl CoA:acetate/3-ketoacid CoA transferase alpha subunit/acyl CoA:acetate/3-ketoacid CoA transferase beta subunit
VTTDAPTVTSVGAAVRDHVRAGDALHVVVGHTRWSAAVREVVRQWWDRDPRFTLVMLSLSSLGALFFRGGLVDRVVTGYSGDTFPNFTPNPWFQRGYGSDAVEVEHWSFLAFAQRLEAGARGLPAITTRSIGGSSMAQNAGFAAVDTPFGAVCLLAPLQADVAILHAPVADRAGNVAVAPPLLEGVWGALGARRGAIVTVERVVDDLRPWSDHVRIPSHRVLAVCQVPMGAHPGGLFARDLPVDGYGEDYDFWIEARAASRRDDYDEWIRQWILEPDDQDAYLARLGVERVDALRAKADPAVHAARAAAHEADLDAPVNAWECAATFAARHLADRVTALGAHAVLAGAGVANLAAWLGVQVARDRGCDVQLTAEIGLWGYAPMRGDPFVLNHGNFPTATMLGDAAMVLGGLVGGAGTTTIGCLGGAQIDRLGNINSTAIPDGPFLVGSGGGNDVASVAAENVVVATLTTQRTPVECGYVTSPGRTVRALVTDLGLLEKVDGDELVLSAIPEGPEPAADRVERAIAACGWPLRVASDVRELPAPTADEIAALRSWDPNGWFLRG